MNKRVLVLTGTTNDPSNPNDNKMEEVIEKIMFKLLIKYNIIPKEA